MTVGGPSPPIVSSHGDTMLISLYDKDRFFDAKLHLVALEENRIVLASFVGLPEAVRAITAGMIEGRPIKIVQDFHYRHYGENYKFLVKPIGLGDVAHGLVYHSQATIEGITEQANTTEQDTLKGYIAVLDGDIQRAVADHVIKRFSLPTAWKDEYWRIFSPFIQRLTIVRNPAFNSIWPDFQILKLEISEDRVKEIMTDCIKNGVLKIEKGIWQGIFRPGMTLKEYLTENAEILAKKLRGKKPRYIQGTPLHPAIGDMARVPLPAQASVVQGLWNAFQDGHSTVIINGAMGTGKSIMACAMSNVFHYENLKKGKKGTAILLSAPSITLAKWMNAEILPTLPEAKVTIINSTDEALKLLRKVRNGYKPEGLEFYLVSLDRAKLGAVPHFAGTWKRVKDTYLQYAWHCPECGRPLVKKDDDGEKYVYVEWEDIAEGSPPDPINLQSKPLNSNGLPFVPKWRRQGKKLDKCNAHLIDEGLICESPLWRPALKSRGETTMSPRWNVSLILKKIKGFFDLYIVDEVHQAKAEDSGRGDAFAQLVGVAPKRLLLTGTLTTGRSSSIKEILWRTKPEMLLKQGFNHKTSAVAWARRYGKLKTVIEVEEGDHGWVVRKKRKAKQPQELPGINPQLTVQLLDFTAFIDLPDLGLPLVPLKEEVEIVQLDDEHYQEYKEFHDTLYEKCKGLAIVGVKGAFSKFIPATINYACHPALGAEVKFISRGEDGNKKIETISAKAFSKDYFTAKERRLVEIVKEELAKGRGCVIYNNYTDTYQMNERTLYVLKQHGISAKILDEPNTLKRMERLKKLEDQGVKVIITNMKLVEVGLDLLAWPTIIFNQLNYEINTVRQASRRAWRVGQDRTCKVIYLVADGTQEMAQFLHLVKQRSHALMVEGILDQSPLKDFAKDEQNTLAADLANCFAKSGLADVWKSLADKELEHVEMVDEADFKQVLAERMKLLANRTRELCGLPPIGDSAKVKEVQVEENKAAKPAADNKADEETKTPEPELVSFEPVVENPVQLSLFDFIDEQTAVQKG